MLTTLRPHFVGTNDVYINPGSLFSMYWAMRDFEVTGSAILVEPVLHRNEWYSTVFKLNIARTELHVFVGVVGTVILELSKMYTLRKMFLYVLYV